MRFLSVFFLFFVAIVFEIAILPQWFGSAVPAISIAVFFLGVAFQGFWPALWFAGLAGILRDVIAPSQDATHTLFFFGIFFVMQFFAFVSNWDEIARRIAAIGAGIIIGIPLSWFAASLVGRSFFHLATPVFSVSELLSRSGAIESIFTIVWFSVAVWVSIRWVRTMRRRAMSRISL